MGEHSGTSTGSKDNFLVSGMKRSAVDEITERKTLLEQTQYCNRQSLLENVALIS